MCLRLVADVTSISAALDYRSMTSHARRSARRARVMACCDAAGLRDAAACGATRHRAGRRFAA